MSARTVRVSDVALALYRTYRPGSLAEVIGQEHVTEPLARALDSGRTHHAYLFSGPRGCGKTSTARIMARSLNCEQGPRAQPCGQCRSCVELAPNGPGSMDVVELDAATHRGIDDARDLREKAIYAPAASRFKIYIIDEAHQLTNEAANALLKLVEEPPPHLRFIFATTEPDKIIPTIRSRTFHYGFRLVPARTLADHLGSVCRSEGVPAEAPALAIVARAGAGSVRDSLSVLGQLLAGAGPEGLTYADAISALGLTDTSLIDEFVAALSAGSAADMFGIVDVVISAGHDPRRFVTDVLDRLRDLIILRADHEALAKGLIDVPDDEGQRMVTQAQSLGLAELLPRRRSGQRRTRPDQGRHGPAAAARAALRPAGTAGSRRRSQRRPGPPGSTGAGADQPPWRPDRARRVSRPGSRGGSRTVGGADVPAQAGTADADPTGPRFRGPRPPRPVHRPTSTASRWPGRTAAPPGAPPGCPVGGTDTGDLGRRQVPAVEIDTSNDPGETGTTGTGGTQGLPSAEAAATATATATATVPDALPPSPASARSATAAPGDDTVITRIRDAWPSILDRLASSSRVAWTAFHAATPVSCTNGALAVAVAEPGNVRAIAQRGHDERLRQAIIDVLALDLTIDVLHDPEPARPPLSGTGVGANAATVAEGAPAVSAGSPAADATRSTTVSGAPRPTSGPTSRPADVVRKAGSAPAPTTCLMSPALTIRTLIPVARMALP